MTRISSPYRRYFSHPLSSLRSLGGLYIKLYVLRLYGKMWNVITLMWKTLNKLTLYSSKKPLCLSKYVFYHVKISKYISFELHQSSCSSSVFLPPSFIPDDRAADADVYLCKINLQSTPTWLFYCTKKMNKWNIDTTFNRKILLILWVLLQYERMQIINVIWRWHSQEWVKCQDLCCLNCRNSKWLQTGGENVHTNICTFFLTISAQNNQN